MSRAEVGDDVSSRPDRDHVAVADLERRPERPGDPAVMIDRLAVRADEVDVLGGVPRFPERGQAGGGERLADHDVQLGDAADVEIRDADHPTLHLGVVRMLAVMDQLDPDLTPLPRHPADGDVDRVGAGPGHQADDKARRLAAAFEEVVKGVGHGGPSDGELRSRIDSICRRLRQLHSQLLLGRKVQPMPGGEAWGVPSGNVYRTTASLSSVHSTMPIGGFSSAAVHAAERSWRIIPGGGLCRLFCGSRPPVTQPKGVIFSPILLLLRYHDAVLAAIRDAENRPAPRTSSGRGLFSGRKFVNLFRIALANIRFPAAPEESIALAERAIDQASDEGARIIGFPECFVPGYRAIGKPVPPPDPEFLERAWSVIAEAAAKAGITVILGTERLVNDAPVATALVIDPDGSIAGFQDKVQIDPSEEGTYRPGSGRRVFQAGPLTFGIAICHEGWRYPETVRWAARHGAHVVFHPQFHEAEPGSYRPSAFADPANTFHEKAVLCRAAENTCYFATVNYASDGSPTTSAIVRPDGTLLAYQPYGEEGLLIAEIDITAATGLLASRLLATEYGH